MKIKPQHMQLFGKLFATSLLLCSTSYTYALQPSAAQIEQFKSLPPAQQQALARQYGIDLNQLGAASSTSAQPKLSETVSVQARAAASTPGSQAIETNAQEASDEVSLADDKERKVTTQQLKQFGYDLFSGAPSTFAPATDIPIPSEYIVGPGDNIVVQLYGKENASYALTINREGQIQFPEIGPLSVAGLSFVELKELITTTVDKQMIGVKASITMGELRSIRIFVLGEATRPGSYTVSSLSTMTNALFVSGGISKIGSLRNIQLKRSGKLITTMDLYDLLLNGDTSSDARLLPGDVIFIPPIGKTVGVNGEVRRPAIYELKKESVTEDMIQLAGGFLPTAYPQASRIERINKNGDRTLVDVDLSAPQGKALKVRDADILQVFSVLETMEDVVLLEGHVKRSGGFAWKKGLRISDLIYGVGDLLPNPDLDYALLRRENSPTREISMLRVNLREALSKPSSSSNLLLQSRDTLFVFGLQDDRKKVVAQINDQLIKQTKLNAYPAIAKISGNVHLPGEYPVHQNMTLGELINAAIGLKAETDFDYAILSRRDSLTAQIHIEAIKLNQDSYAQTINPADHLYIFHVYADRSATLDELTSELKKQASNQLPATIANITGHVRFPGTYPLTRDLSLEKLITYSGGVTAKGYNLEAEITRFRYDENQERIIEHFQIAVGGDEARQFFLQSEDTVQIKQRPNWIGNETVTLVGEIAFPGEYTIHRNETLSQLIERAGGLNSFAYPEAAVFTREELRQLEAQRLEELQHKLKSEIAAMNIEQQKEAEKIDTSDVQQLLDNLNSIKPMGRMVIDLPRILQHSAKYDVVLKEGDVIRIPRYRQSVTVVGEVQFATSHLYQQELDAFDYIQQSGGTTAKADPKRIYVVKANGQVTLPEKSSWFNRQSSYVQAGDTVVVPLDADRIKPLTLWGSVSQIFYQIALGAAAVASF